MQHRFRKAFPLIHSRLQIETIVNAFSDNQISNYMFDFSELISITIQYYFKKMNSELSNYSKLFAQFEGNTEITIFLLLHSSSTLIWYRIYVQIFKNYLIELSLS